MRPSLYALALRPDNGPFIRVLATGDSHDPTLVDDWTDAPATESRGHASVYYSDVAALEHDSPDWHLLLEVTPELITLYPIIPRATRHDYAHPKYNSITSIIVAAPKYAPYSIPQDRDDVEGVLASLPRGLSKDWRFGLGFLYEYRYIPDAISQLGGVDTILIHGSDGGNDARVDGHLFVLGQNRLEDLRSKLDRLSQRHQRETAADKNLVCYTGLLHHAAPYLYPPKAKKLPPNVLADLTSLGRGPSRLSRSDQHSAARLVHDNVDVMAKTERRTLFNLKAEIELVTLGELIEVFAKMLTSNAKEAQWQTFLSEHPFVLDMAFGYPVKMIAERPYVGGKSFTGRGGQYSDFLVAAKATGNLALIEIKHAQHDLLGKLYRNKTYMPSEELTGSVAQVISQRALVHRNILILADELDERVHAHAVAAIIIIGRTPDTREKQRAFEQYRNSLKDVLIVTFDELEERLRSIHRALVSSPPTVPIEDDDLPF